MTGVEVIVAALAVGAAAGATEMAKTAVVDAYTGLRGLLRRRMTDPQAGEPPAGAGRPAEALSGDALTEPSADLAAWRARVAARLVESGADRDNEVLAAAQRLLELADPDGTRAGRYVVTVSGGQGVQVGAGTVAIGAAYGPTAGTMTGPVSVTYGQLPVPPVAPEA